MKHPGISVGDDVGPPVTEAPPTSDCLAVRFPLVGELVRTANRDLMALSSLVVLSLASAISPGSKE